MRRNVAISLRDRTKHSPSAIAEIEACTCPVRKGRAPLSLLRLSTLARSLAPSRSPVSLALLVSSSLYPSAAPVRPRNSHALFLSLSVPSCTVRRFAPSSSLHSSYTLSRFYFFLLHLLRALSRLRLWTEFCGTCLSSSPPVRHALYFSDLSPLLSAVFSSAGRAVWLCVYAITLFSSTDPANAVSRFTHASLYAAIAEVESLIK